MSFTEWIFLLGGLAVAGPLIAHLLAKPRYRRLPFTMLRFLRTGQTQSQSRRKLRDLLILLLRCTIIVLIALLFARPILHIRHKPEQTRHTYSLGLDNSMSMAYSDGDGVFFDKLKDSAVDCIRSAEPDGLFNICAMATGDWMQGLSKEQALAEVKALKIEPASANIGDFLSGLDRANHEKKSDDETSVLVLSDFTPNTLQQLVRIAEPVAVDRIDYTPTLSPKPINNAAIVEAHVAGMAGGILTVSAVIVNYGQTTQNRHLIARTGSHESALADIKLLPSQRGTFQVQIDLGASGQESSFWPVKLSLSEGDGLGADDSFYLAVSLPGHNDINVLLAGQNEHEMFLLKTAMVALSSSSSNSLSIKEVSIDKLSSTELDWADVIICSAISNRLGYLASSLKEFVSAGGKLVSFVTGSITSEAAKQLWQRSILAALPGKCVREQTFIQPKSCNNQPSDMDHATANSLSNYRIDKILLKGYFECEPHSDSQCLWQLQNGSGFVYCKPLGAGSSILVNTSADDSLGSLTKSNASVAFCQYLLGQDNQIGEHCFARDERVKLPVPSGTQPVFWVQTCDGKKQQAAVINSFLQVSNPGGIGWVNTIGKPTLYAGINLPQGETDMTPPDIRKLDEIMIRVFPTDSSKNQSSADVLGDRKPRPTWKILAWIIILLLLLEPAVANRMKR